MRSRWVRLFGSVEAVVDDRPCGPSAPMAKAVLARLALTPGVVVRREQLFDDLWGDDLPRTAATSLRVHVTAVRRALGDDGGDLVVFRNGGYLLDGDAVGSDLADAEELARRGRELLRNGDAARAATELAAARRLLEGEILGGIPRRPPFAPHIAALEAARAEVVRSDWQCRLAAGRGAELVAELEAATTADPLDEAVLVTLVEALAQAGRHVAAVRRCAEHRERLAALGLLPGTAVQDVEGRVLRHETTRPGPSPVVSSRPPFVGRAAQLRALDEALHRWRAAEPAVALVVGAPGEGKSRLVSEWLAISGLGPPQVLLGGCSPEQGLPFEPFLGLLDGWPARSGSDGSVARLLSDPGDAHLALAGALVERVRGAAGGAPVVLVLDDLQWADRGSLSMIRFLVRTLRGHVLFVLVSRRTGHGSEVAGLFGDLVRDGAVTVETGPLDAAEIESLLGGAAPVLGDDDVNRIAAASEGNPLFALALARQRLVEPGRVGLPPTVLGVLQRLVAQLSQSRLELLERGAVIGRRFALRDVVALEGQPDHEVIDELDALVRDGFLVTTDAIDHFAFTHDLMRQTVLEGMLPLRRSLLHLRFADHLASRGHEASPVDVAEHLLAARSLCSTERLVDAVTESSVCAFERGQYETALRHAVAGLDACSDARTPERAKLLVVAAMGWVVSGEVDRGRRGLAEASSIAAAVRDDRLVVLAVRAYQLLGAPGRGGDDRLRLLRDAVARIRTTGDANALSQALVALSHELLVTSDRTEWRRCVEELVALARHGDDRLVRRSALLAQAELLEVEVGDPAERERVLAEAEHVASSQATVLQAYVFIARAGLALSLGDLNRAAQASEQLAAVSDHTTPLKAWLARGIAIGVSILRGDWAGVDEALAAFDADGRARRIGHNDDALMAMTFLLAWGRGRLGELVPVLDAMRSNGVREAGLFAHGHAVALLEIGATAEAEAVYRGGIERTLADPRRSWLWLPELVLAGEAAASVGRADEAAHLLALLDPLAGQHAALRGPVGTFGPVDRVRSLLLERLGRSDAADDLWRRTLRHCHETDNALWAAVMARRSASR